LMLLHSPRSSLFPYTTLFRSPEFAIYLFSLIVSSFTAIGLLSFDFLNGFSSFLKGLLNLEGAAFPPCLLLSYEPPLEKDGFLLSLLPLFPLREFILKKFLQRYENI